LLEPYQKAAKSGSLAAPAWGKPSSFLELINNVPSSNGGVSVFGGVGERSREGNDLWREMQESKLSDGSPVLSKTVCLWPDERAAGRARARVGLTALTQAEYFRDVEGADTLSLLITIRYVGRRGSVRASGSNAFRVGYQPTLGTEVGRASGKNRLDKKGSITSIQAVYVPRRRHDRPCVATTFQHLDATPFFRGRSQNSAFIRGRSFGIDVAYLDPKIVGEEHYQAAAR